MIWRRRWNAFARRLWRAGNSWQRGDLSWRMPVPENGVFAVMIIARTAFDCSGTGMQTSDPTAFESFGCRLVTLKFSIPQAERRFGGCVGTLYWWDARVVFEAGTPGLFAPLIPPWARGVLGRILRAACGETDGAAVAAIGMAMIADTLFNLPTDVKTAAEVRNLIAVACRRSFGSQRLMNRWVLGDFRLLSQWAGIPRCGGNIRSCWTARCRDWRGAWLGCKTAFDAAAAQGRRIMVAGQSSGANPGAVGFIPHLAFDHVGQMPPHRAEDGQQLDLNFDAENAVAPLTSLRCPLNGRHVYLVTSPEAFVSAHRPVRGCRPFSTVWRTPAQRGREPLTNCQ